MVRKLLYFFCFFAISLSAWGGTCPSGSNYVNLSSPGTGGNSGSSTLASQGILQCFYISSSGLDSNTGVDETHSWLHAPGMSSFTGTHTTIAGDAFIFRGGDTWHYTTGTPATGGTITPTASGNGTNPIYYTIDPTWFSGGSFARPILSMDNTLSTSFVASCSAADDNTLKLFDWSSRTNIFVDGIEFTGACWNGNPSGAYVNSGTSGGVLRSYFHGWTAGTSASDDTWRGVNGGGGTTNIYYYDVFDGTDSTASQVCTVSSCVASVWNGSGTPSPIPATFWAMDDCATLAYSIFIHTSQGCEAGSIVLLHDNFFDFIFEPGYGRHGNVIETLSQSTGTFTAYNNIVANVNEGEMWNPAAPTMYIYNNVVVNDQHEPPTDGNCFLLEPTGNNSFTVITVTFLNNSTDGTCGMTAHLSTWASGSSITAENNQLTGRSGVFSGSSFFNCNTGAVTPHNVCSTTDNGGEIFSATGGYTIANFWQPTSGTDSTVGKGNNITSTCGTGGITNDLCSSLGGVSESSSWGGFIATYPSTTINARPGSGAWDSGSYEFNTAPASFTCTPTTIPSHHTNNIAVLCTGVNTAWTGSTAFSISGVTGATLASKSNSSATSETLQITTGSGTGTLTITDTTDSITTTITVSTATLGIFPTLGNRGTTPTLALTCTGPCLWLSETASTLFSLSGGTGASLATPTVTSNTTASAVLTVGTIAGTLTITDTSTAATATFIVSSTAASASTCSPGTGTYTATQTPACTNPNSGTTVQCYTTNGSTPATNTLGTGCTTGTSLTSGATVSIAVNTTLKIIAGTNINTDSVVNTYVYTLQGAAPTFSPVGGFPPQTVTISQAQSLAICYRTDGATPASNGSGTCVAPAILYTGVVSVVTPQTLTAIGMASGWTDSSVGTATFAAGSTVGTGAGSGNFTFGFSTVTPTLNVTPAGTGTTTINPGGIVCPPTCTPSFANGTVVTLTQTASLPYVNAGFSSPPCTLTVDNNLPCSLTLRVNTAVTSTFQAPQLPLTWVNNTEYNGTTTNTINFPASSTGGSWTCGATNYGPYTAASQSSLQQAVNDAESCRTANGSGTTIAIPPALYTGANGITLPQTAGDTSTNFIVLTSTSPLTPGQTACSHGVEDNIVLATQPGIRNLGCTGANMSYQLGTTINAVSSGAFTLANGTATNTSAYNDIASMYTIECTANSCNAIQSATWDINNVGPHHFAVLNAELRPQAGLVGSSAPFAMGQNTETIQTQLPTHIHLAYSYLHGDWTDAPMSGCPSTCIATGAPTGANSLPSLVAFNGCVYCSVVYVYMDKAIRPGSEGHAISALLAQQTKYTHNWVEGQAIGKLCGGFSNAISFTNFVTCQDEEDRANRYTYPYSWMLAENVPIIRQISKNGSAGTGSGYLVNDVITVVQTGGSSGTGTITAVGAGGTITAVTVTTAGTGYFPANGLSVTGGSGTSGTVNIGTGYFPNASVTNGYTRKNAHEYKFGERVLEDGNIYENVTNAGAQNGTDFSHKTAQTSSGVLSTNTWTTLDNVTVTNIVARNSCNGPSLGDRSDAGGGNGGGVSLPNEIFFGSNWLVYNASVFFLGNPNSNLTSNSCAGATPQYGWRIGSSVPGNTWAVAPLRDPTGFVTTLTLTAASGLGVSDIAVGDPITVTGCSDTSFNVGNNVMGPPALTGTLLNGLTVVYSNPGVGGAGSGVTGCTLSSAQGWPNYYAFSHITMIDDPLSQNNPSNSANGGTNIFPLARNFTITNSILINGGLSSTAGAGTRTSTRMYDPVSMQFNNTLLPSVDGSVTCPGHGSPSAGGMAACYTEYTPAYVAVTPATLYGVPASFCSGNDPATGNCAGVLAAMSAASFPIIVSDWTQYRLCKSTDASCNSKASLYAAGSAHQATDGTDLGFNPTSTLAAEVLNQYVCATPCGSPGPFADH
jgi:hypothetical protein